MALEGTIKDFGLADILQLIGIQRKTGVLTLDDGEESVTVKFLDGQVVGAETRARNLEDLLGSVLVRTGRITHAHLQDALRIQRETLQRLGYILVRQRFISEEDLVEALRIQVTQIVYRLFRWRDGSYQFHPSDQVDYDREHFQPLAAETILMEGARMIDEWPIIERRVKSPSMVFRKTEAGRALDVPVESTFDTDLDVGFRDGAERESGRAAERLTREERGILHIVGGGSTVQDIVDASPLGEFDVYRTLYDLYDRNLIEETHISAVAAVAPVAAERSRWLSGGLLIAVWALALLGTLTVPRNPWTPWSAVAGSAETELLRTHASRTRIERLERALDTYYLDRGAMPETLERLVEGRYVVRTNLIDPWGQPYRYRHDATGYEIAAVDATGAPREDLRIRHRFSASRRMVLGGGLPELPAAIP